MQQQNKMENAKNVNVSVTYNKQKTILEIPPSESIGKLKTEIYKLYDIPPDKQVIVGWTNMPIDDDDLLQNSVQMENITNLLVENVDHNIGDASNQEGTELEIEAAVSFISKIMNKFDNSPIHFHACKLQDAISEACMVPLEKRKALCLYLHNENDKFSSVLYENIRKSEVTEILNRNFFFLGYDIEETKYQSALINALHRCRDLASLLPLVESKVAAAVCIVPIQDSVTIFSCIRGKVSNKDFHVALSNTENFLIVENQQEKHLEELMEKTGSENDIGSTNYQKLMADMLGDRDWDRFEHDQHDYLKKKIAFALLGPPQREEGYEKKDLKKVQALYENILKSNHEIAKCEGRVEISFLYNCTEPLPSEKMSRAKKYKEYNPNTDVMPLPIFALRKCRGSPNPCRIFVDNIGRTYQTWYEYIMKNKFHQCEMILPLNGRYEVNENGEVLLERHLSPACGVDSKLLQGADYLSTAGGLISGGIFVAAAIPAIAVAPAALIAGGVIGLGVGIYSMGRSAYTLYDRKKHKETLTFANSEARGAYLTILAGSLGFVGAGATVAVSQLTAVGVNVGQGAGAAIKTIGFVNLGASGMSMLNSGYDVIDHWIKENYAASLLTIIQLKSSILFFGNVIHDTDSREINEAQARTMQNYQESLRNNRLRKPFLMLRKMTLRKHEGQNYGNSSVISSIVKIPNKDELFVILAVNDETECKKRVSFTINDNEVKLNNESVEIDIDIGEVVNINERDVSMHLSNHYLTSISHSTDVEYVTEIVFNVVKMLQLSDEESFTTYMIRILNCFENDTKCKIIDAFEFLLKKITKSVEETLHDIFPNQSKYIYLVDVVICFFGQKSEKLREQWKTWLSTRKDDHYIPFFEQIDEDESEGLQFFEKAVEICYQESSLTEQAGKEFLSYFYNWLTKQIFDNQIMLERDWRKKEMSLTYSSEKISCTVCGGYFYKISRKT